MNDPAVYFQKDEILFAMVMFRNLTRSERFLLLQTWIQQSREKGLALPQTTSPSRGRENLQ